MFLSESFSPKISDCFPRVRGDVPTCAAAIFRHSSFSPRARGCSGLNLRRELLKRVFPACAGMFRGSCSSPISPPSFPRVRGDVPFDFMYASRAVWFSPRARGCSLHDDHPFCVCVVFPACAGMFLPRRGLGLSGSGFPRVRGDVPVTGLPTRLSALFSPRARGCS